MIKKNQITRGVRVKILPGTEPISLAHKYLFEEPVILIEDSHIYNDQRGEFVFLKGGSRCNSAELYLDQIEPYYPFSDAPLYPYGTTEYEYPSTKLIAKEEAEREACEFTEWVGRLGLTFCAYFWTDQAKVFSPQNRFTTSELMEKWKESKTS